MAAQEEENVRPQPTTEIRLLGPLQLRFDSVIATPRARKPRQLLVLLLLRINRFVPISYLLRGLWDDSPPRSATTTLQTYVLQLRNSLGKQPERGAKDILITMDGGYMLSVQGACFDLHTYQNLVSEGINALRSGKDHEAKQSLTSALDLWNGDALADVRHGQILETEAARLEESRLRALEHRIEADLRLGRCWEVLEELSTLSMRYPVHENFHTQYMLALYCSGHRLEALKVFHRLRSALISEVGVEPTARLQQLHQTILTSDRELDSGKVLAHTGVITEEHLMPVMRIGS